MQSGENNETKYAQMTTRRVETLICRLAGPSIIIMMISALYNMADTYFVGTIGTSATAAVGIAFSLMAIIQAIGFFFGHGSGNYISRQLGAQNIKDAARMASTGFFSAFTAGVLVTVLGLIFLEPLCGLLGATKTIYPYARQYMFFILFGAPWMTGSLMLNNLLRYQGNSLYGMVGMTTGAILNIVLDPILIFVFKMGVAGAGLATAFSQFVSCCILLFCCSKRDNIPIRFKNFKPQLPAYKEMIRGGTPSLCRQSIASIAAILINHTAGVYGDGAIAAISIVSRVTMFASSALIGFGQGFQPVCGFNYGAGQYERVKKAFWFCIKLSSGILVVLAVAGAVFAPQIIGVFRADDLEVIRIGARGLRLQCIAFPFMSWITMGSMMLQTIGKAGRASLLAVARQGIFLIPLLFLLPDIGGLPGLQLCQPISDICTFLLTLPLTLVTLKEMANMNPRK